MVLTKEKANNEEPVVLLRPENTNKKYEALFLEIDCGQIKLPMFQREFVWDKEQSAKLIDSILKGYPIGTFIFWKTKETLRSVKDIGNHKLPETPKGTMLNIFLTASSGSPLSMQFARALEFQKMARKSITETSM